MQRDYHGTSLEPGQRVYHPDRPDWGEGQVQSVAGPRVTVNFEHAGAIDPSPGTQGSFVRRRPCRPARS